jgi:hypothetical protein
VIVVLTVVIQTILLTVSIKGDANEGLSETDGEVDDNASGDKTVERIAKPSSYGSQVPLISDKSMMVVGNTCCATLFCITFYYILFFMQAIPFGYMLNDTTDIRLRSTGEEYRGSYRSAWVEAAVGHTWTLDSMDPQVFVVDDGNLHITGSIFFGVVSAYSAVMFLISIYCAYTATPTGVYTALFLDVRSLTILNGFILLGMQPMVQEVFINCKPAGQFDIYVFLLLVCFDEYLFFLTWYLLARFTGIQKLLGMNPDVDIVDKWASIWGDSIIQPIWITILSFMPLFWGFIIYKTSAVSLLTSVTLWLLVTSIAWLNYYTRGTLSAVHTGTAIQRNTYTVPLEDELIFSIPSSLGSNVLNIKGMRYMA